MDKSLQYSIIEYRNEILAIENIIEQMCDNPEEIKREALKMSKETTKSYLECLYELTRQLLGGK